MNHSTCRAFRPVFLWICSWAIALSIHPHLHIFFTIFVTIKPNVMAFYPINLKILSMSGLFNIIHFKASGMKIRKSVT